MKHKTLLFLILLSLISGCGNRNTSTRQTLPEEKTIDVLSTTDQGKDFGPLPDPDWDDENYVLQNVAQAKEPTFITTRFGDDNLWVAERQGTVRVLRKSLIKHKKGTKIESQNGESVTISETEYYQLSDQISLDIKNKISVGTEGGLLGIAFSNNGNLLYASYTNLNGDSVISSFKMSGENAISSSEKVLLEVPQPFKNHNGGQISIGPDGFLYIALGDGGGSGDPEGNSQNKTNLLGSILRIDPDEFGEKQYEIPESNPFKDNNNEYKEEIWLNGVRNPWRFSFDSDTGDLWIADVGQNTEEEINFIKKDRTFAGKGLNLGWNFKEGNSNFKSNKEPENYHPPIYTYLTTEKSCSVVGGYVYRGELISERIDGEVRKPLEGIYLFTDYCSPGIRGLEVLEDGRALVKQIKLNRNPSNVISFSQIDNEIYILEQNGQISRIVLDSTNRGFEIIPPGGNLPKSNLSQDSQVLPGDPDAEKETTTTQ